MPASMQLEIVFDGHAAIGEGGYGRPAAVVAVAGHPTWESATVRPGDRQRRRLRCGQAARTRSARFPPARGPGCCGAITGIPGRDCAAAMAVDLTRDPNLLELWQIRILLKPTAIGRQGHEPGDPGPVELAHGFIERIGPGSNHRKVPLRVGVLYDVGLMLARAECSAPLAAAWSWGRPGARRRGRPAAGRSCS